MRSARAIRTTEKPARSNSIPWQRTVRGGSTGPHIAIGSKSRQQTVRGASIRNKSWQQTVHGASSGSKSWQQTVRGASMRNKSWQQTVHGASTGPAIRGRALTLARDALQRIA